MTMLLRAFQIVGWCFVVALALVAAFALAGNGITSDHPVVEYKDFVSILLTAIAVMIGIGAVAAAFAAIWGFELLRREIVKAAAEIAAKAAEEKIDEVVPGLVEKALKFDREVPGPEADKIAREFGKED
jgi:predicted RNase H-like nuclease